LLIFLSNYGTLQGPLVKSPGSTILPVENNQKDERTMGSVSKTTGEMMRAVEEDTCLYKLYKNVVENLREGIWIGKKNKGFTTLYWNNAAEKISGYDTEHLKGRTLLKIVPALKEIVEEIAANPNGSRKRIAIERYQYNHAQQGNNPRFLNIQAYFLSEEKVIAIIFEDITEKATMERNIIQQNRELSALNQIGHTVNQTLELNTVLNTSLDKVLEVMDCEGGGIYMRESKESEDLVLRVKKGLSPLFCRKFKKIRLGVGLMGKGLANHEAVILESVTKKTKLTAHRAPEGMKLAVSVPITVKDRLIGAFNVASYVSTTFDPGKVQLLLTIGNHIGVVIENAMLMDSLKHHERDLQILSSEIIKAQEEERKRISRELHDEASQALVAAKINLEMIEKRLPPDLEEVATSLAETSSLLVRTLENLRRLARDLRPSILDDLGLIPTLRWYTESYAKRLGIPITFKAVALDKRLDFEIETVIYRIVQEALTNIAKYAQAKEVSISLNKKNATLITTIEDNGKGFAQATSVLGEHYSQGSGILGMKERVNNLGGHFQIESKQGKGTKLLAEIPLTG
jgi:PAS domain S-box-containing protein